MSNSKNRNAEHNLIFAGLGLQLGIIAKDKVIRAFTEWLFDKARPLGEILVHQKAITPDQRKTLESAVEAHIQQEGGEQKALASLNHVKDLESDLDHLADNDLNQTLDGAVTQRKLLGLDVLFSQSHDSESSTTNKKGSISGLENKQIDRFERQHFLDSGNLGEVFFAKDTELNRTVVTKYIRPEMSGDTLKQALFHLEGEVTGALEHPSVVPVYGMGKDIKGRLNYAMRYIRGKKLSRVIAEYHRKEAGLKQEALTGLLQNFQAVCLAIEYAHSKGVLHCDIKPDNIMIGDYGEVFVVDWGLVVVCGGVKGSSDMLEMETLDPGVIPPYKPSELASSGLHEQQGGSRRGIGGTPAYMAPEQFIATMSEDISLVTPKADIYALGSTLYHILTGKAPHLPKEGVKESLDAFYFRITTGMILTPREKDASIPKLLEQIVLKAMQVEPEDRYASARELAEDIKRYVSDEPVHAYQESGLEKARRWVRKNKSLVGAAMVMLFLALPSMVLIFVIMGFNKELEKSNLLLEASKIAAETERDRANRNEKLAQEKLTDIKKVQEEAESYKIKINKIANSLDLALIPAGTFIMGSPRFEKDRNNDETQHEVTITKPFYIGKYEVTQEQWELMMGKNPSEIKGKKLPVTDVSWEDCQNFIKKLNKNTKGGYRLPTEAEWEYTCRAGTTTAYSFGRIITPEDANYWPARIGEPKVVGSYKPNAFGLHDMHGNVFEWCEDWYGDYSEEAETDPKGPATGEHRVIRGVPNISDAIVRSSNRNIRFPPNYRGSVGGFRLAKTIDSEDLLKPNVKKLLLEAEREVEAKTIEKESKAKTKAKEEEDKAKAKAKEEERKTKAKEAQKKAAIILHKEVEEKEDLGEGIKLDLVLIPASKFKMESFEVTIADPFYIGKYEVTQEQWESVMGNNPSEIKDGKYPVTDVSWEDCKEFIKKLNTKTKGGYRLPTEPEWEHACRAGTTTAYSFGNEITPKDANYRDSKIGRPVAVGCYSPNAFGLYDMHGNVWEWCEDWNGLLQNGEVTDLIGPLTGEHGVLRGGSFYFVESFARSSFRSGITPIYGYYAKGFRLAKTP